jgi:hypothetical protein
VVDFATMQADVVRLVDCLRDRLGDEARMQLLTRTEELLREYENPEAKTIEAMPSSFTATPCEASNGAEG